MKYIFSVILVLFFANSANAMYQNSFSPDALGISQSVYKDNNSLLYSYSIYSNEKKLDESLIDQLISSFPAATNEYNFDESLIDQLIASFPDILDSYLSVTPSKEISLYELLVDSYKS